MFSGAHRPSGIRNRILLNIALSDFGALRPFLHPAELHNGFVLSEPNKPIEYVTFVESGLVSLMTLARDGGMLETAMVGHHGVVGASVVLGARTSMHRSIVSIPGKAWRIRADDLQRLMIEQPQIRELLLRYVQSLMVHSSQTGLCGVRHELSQRLASWLCLACDSLGGETIVTTHDYLSHILGLRRAGVTEALAGFEKFGLIRKSRGVLHVRERDPLQRRACGCYEVIANSYGWAVRQASQMPCSMTDIHV